MLEWRNAKVTGNFRKAFEVANDIAWLFNDEKIRSAYVLFAAMFDEESGLSKAFLDMEMRLVPPIKYYANNKEVFAQIFGEDAANKLFEEEIPENSETIEEELGQDAELEESEEEIFKAKVVDALMDLAIEYGSEVNEAYEVDMLEPVYSDKLELDIDEFIQSLKISANIVDFDGTNSICVPIPSSLESCLENVNMKYDKGEECTILGRDKEIFKAFNVFSKKTKRNCVLVGEPGVGKTAIIEAITQSIVNETCPKEFIGYTVLSLDVNSMVAGTKYRGEFETKVAILKKFLEGTSKIILFVDEMHQMLGAGGTSEGTVDLSGSLKPILSRDDVVFVGATTVKEYEQILSRDGAFKRRFEVIKVREPKNDEIKPMIRAKIRKMEEYHMVKLPEKLLDYIILCSTCFNHDTCNPDKTLDLCDRSMAISKMQNKKRVTKADINKVYEECFEHHNIISKNDARDIAYHEIGHYVVNRLTKAREAYDVKAISIIPGDGFLGVNVLEEKDSFVSANKEFSEARIMSLLAGRVAQEKVSKRINSGARSDLKKAKAFAKDLIAENGMDDSDEFRNIYLLDDDLFNEQLASKIDEKANNLIKKLYLKTEEFINLHWDEVDKMAKYLIKNKIVTSEELEQFIAE